jgi:nitroreductase
MHRAFRDGEVAVEDVQRLVDAAVRAPMAANISLRRIVVVSDAAIIRTVRQVTPGLSVEPPVLIALCTDLAQAETATGAHGRDISSYIDAGAAAENVALAATALGLGVSFARSCTEPAIRVALGLPAHVRPDILVAVGQPVENPQRPAKRPPPIVYMDQYGERWPSG